MTSDPNPQPWVFSAYETVQPTLKMTPALTVPWTGAETFELNIRDEDGNVVLQRTTFTETNQTNGIGYFGPLTSTETGVTLSPAGQPGKGGDYLYDMWRTDAGNEKRLAWGSLTVRSQQWKP